MKVNASKRLENSFGQFRSRPIVVGSTRFASVGHKSHRV